MLRGDVRRIEIKCPRCGTLNVVYRAASPPPERPERQKKDASHGQDHAASARPDHLPT
ncbi:MAG: Com family DNA-binding transcriptional regulator [Reyranella sp.]|nr:Com family DNA-binding transcriptional regulator [Reyranella sp.]